MTATDRTKLRDATKARPCPICRGDHKCRIGDDDGRVLCGRQAGDVPGYICRGACKGDPQFTMYFVDDSHNRNGKHTGPKPTAQPIDWKARHEAYCRNLTPALTEELAEALGLPVNVLEAVDTGYIPEEGCWVTAEHDARGNIIGLNRRYRDGSKKMLPDGHRGLTLPAFWKESSDPLLLVEGVSDVLALSALGQSAVGRPSNVGGVELLVDLLRDVPNDRTVIVLGERDRKPDGNWPGRYGAKRTAEQLAEKTGRQILWSLPPVGFKDARAWYIANVSDATESPVEVGGLLLAHVVKYARGAGSVTGYRFDPIDSATFAQREYKLSWLVKRLFVAQQLACIGAARKTLKTCIMLDLAISLGTGKPFLGFFQVYEKQRVVVLSGESGEFVLKETALRICAAKDKVQLADADVLWDFRLPQLADPAQLDELTDGLRDREVTVVLIDPLFLCLLAGDKAKDLSAANLFHTGPLLLGVAQACIAAGATPIIVHHTNRPANKKTKDGGKLDLDDLSYSGVAEATRQWLLMWSREEFDPTTGHSQLQMSVGGSAGQSGEWALDVTEGTISDDFRGRKWEVIVTPNWEATRQESDRQADAKREREQQRDRDDEAKLLGAVDDLAKGGKTVIYSKARAIARLNTDRMTAALHRLADVLEEYPTTVPTGTNGKTTRDARGLRRKVKNPTVGTVGTVGANGMFSELPLSPDDCRDKTPYVVGVLSAQSGPGSRENYSPQGSCPDSQTECPANSESF